MSTTFGSAETVQFSVSYKGTERARQFFSLVFEDNTAVFHGHICDEDGEQTDVSSVVELLNSIEIQ